MKEFDHPNVIKLIGEKPRKHPKNCPKVPQKWGSGPPETHLVLLLGDIVRILQEPSGRLRGHLGVTLGPPWGLSENAKYRPRPLPCFIFIPDQSEPQIASQGGAFFPHPSPRWALPISGQAWPPRGWAGPAGHGLHPSSAPANERVGHVLGAWPEPTELAGPTWGRSRVRKGAGLGWEEPCPHVGPSPTPVRFLQAPPTLQSSSSVPLSHPLSPSPTP